jgi:putative hydrolase of the HAD superfamily
MTDKPALFWDVGGVVLSNGWDHAARAEAAQSFGFDFEEFEQRHRQAESEFETGAITLETYLNRTVFFRDRPFTRDRFKDFMFSQSHENGETRVLLDDLTAGGRCFLATVNNESKELNEFRIRRFDLARNFSAFFSSCYLRARKPDPLIYQLVLGIKQRAPEQCVFIDDRPENLEPARALGMRTILFRSASGLRASLSELGLTRTFAGG